MRAANTYHGARRNAQSRLWPKVKWQPLSYKWNEKTKPIRVTHKPYRKPLSDTASMAA